MNMAEVAKFVDEISIEDDVPTTSQLFCQEFGTPVLDDWEFFIETKGIKIYRRIVKESGLYEYKVLGNFSDISVDLFTEVYMDLEYRKTWDTYVKVLQILKDQNGIYWEVKYPFPLSNRDYVYQRTMVEEDYMGEKAYVIEAESLEIPTIPEKSGIVRVAGYKQTVALKSNETSGTTFIMYYYDNPGGMIPTWLVNWAAKTGVPNFLDNISKACKSYPAYKQKLEGSN